MKTTLKPGLSRKNAKQLIELADLVASKLAPEAPTLPPLPNLAAKVAALLTARDAADTADDAYEAGRITLGALLQARNAAADTLRVEHAALVSAVESEAKGDPVKLSASGYPLSQPATPASSPPTQIKNLSLTASGIDGALDVQWGPDTVASIYEVQCTTQNPISGPWATVAQPTASKCTINHEESGIRCWVRVRGIGAKGPGAWSDPSTKIVP